MTREIAVVTGAGSGIGAAIATHLASRYDLLLTHLRDDTDLARVVALTERAGATVRTITGDLTSLVIQQTLKDYLRACEGQLAVLVSNAGAYPRIPWLGLTNEQLNYYVAVNLTSHMFCAQAATPHLVDRGSGRIIFVSSVLTQIGRVELAHYIAAKGGMEAFARALARELGVHNITVNTVRPGSIEVPAEHDVVPDHAAMVTRQLDRQCLKRRGTPADVAHAVAFLASEKASFITGQALTVDGGWCLA